MSRRAGATGVRRLKAACLPACHRPRLHCFELPAAVQLCGMRLHRPPCRAPVPQPWPVQGLPAGAARHAGGVAPSSGWVASWLGGWLGGWLAEGSVRVSLHPNPCSTAVGHLSAACPLCPSSCSAAQPAAPAAAAQPAPARRPALASALALALALARHLVALPRPLRIRVLSIPRLCAVPAAAAAATAAAPPLATAATARVGAQPHLHSHLLDPLGHRELTHPVAAGPHHAARCHAAAHAARRPTASGVPGTAAAAAAAAHPAGGAHPAAAAEAQQARSADRVAQRGLRQAAARAAAGGGAAAAAGPHAGAHLPAAGGLAAATAAWRRPVHTRAGAGGLQAGQGALSAACRCHLAALSRRPPPHKLSTRLCRSAGPQVAQRSTPASCWVIISGAVYDLTPFMALGQHPGVCLGRWMIGWVVERVGRILAGNCW